MAEDKEVLREIWEGKIPVTFCLDPSEVVQTTTTTATRTSPMFYLMVPRVSYFPLVMDKMVSNFVPFVDESVRNGRDLWLEYEGEPLKWHYPIGLLWDIHGFDSCLPFNIIVHFSNFPEEILIRGTNTKGGIESHFLATIKEAEVIKRRNNNVMANFQIRDRSQLTMGLYNQKFDQFWSVNRKLMDAPPPFRSIPVRIYYYYVEGGSRRNNVPIQRLFKPVKDDDGGGATATTLFDILDVVQEKSMRDGGGGGGGGGGDHHHHHVIIHGIEPPLETHLQWLSEHFSYPDNFLHICIHR